MASGKIAQIKSVALVSSGNFLEMYDFMVFAYYAKYVAAAFFPASDELSSILAALMAFGAGFLTRPLGGLLLGAYVDRHGRRAGLILSLGLMGLGTLSIAVTPSYAQIGILAPIVVVIGRLLQGLAAGVQVGGVSVYLAEIAPPSKKGFYVAWQSASQQMAVVFAALIGLAAGAFLSKAQMASFGWRIPFFLGCSLIPFLFVVRRWLEETPAFLAQKQPPRISEIVRSFISNWSTILLGAAMAVMTTVFFYMVTSYTPTYGNTVLKLSVASSSIVTICVGAANFILLPTMGSLSDRIGRKPLLIGCALLGLITSYPALLWLVQSPTFGRLLTVELWLAFIYAGYNGAMIVFLTEVMHPAVRTTGFSFAYSLATAVFGGFTPAISTALIRYGQQNGYANAQALPGIWLAGAALLALVAVLCLVEKRVHRRAGIVIVGGKG
jgi:MFS family permease